MPLFHPAFRRLAEADPRFRRAYERVWRAELWLASALAAAGLALAVWAAWGAR